MLFMKKITLVMLLLFLTVATVQAQLYTLPTCSSQGSNLYGPMYSTSFPNSTNRTAVVYPASQLTSISGKVINGLYFNRFSGGVAMAGNPYFKIYVKEMAAIDFGAGDLEWATAISGATLVYDSNPVSSVGIDAGWKLFPLSTNFTYSGTQNLAVFFEYNNTSTSSAFQWSFDSVEPCVNITNSNTVKYTNNSTGVLPTVLTSSDFKRPFIAFDYIESCSSPVSVSTVVTTSNSVNVSVVAPSAAPSNGYEYYYSTTNQAPLSSTVALGTIPVGTTATISSLTSNTTYYLWVRSVCDAGDKSAWKPALPFKTLCDFVTDFIQNFDTTQIGSDSLPDCWSRAGTSSAVYVTTGGGTPGTAPNRLYMFISGTTTAYAILRPVSNLQLNTHRLKFKAHATTTNKSLNVGYFTNPSDVTTFVQLQTYAMPSTAATAAEFTLIPTDIPAGVSQLVLTINPGVNTTIYVDDVKWELNSSCVEPSQLTVNQITTTSAQLAWTNGGPETTWEIQYGLNNFVLGSGTNVTSIPTNPYLLSGLTPGTRYQYYVRGICTGNIPSSWAGPFDFTTECADQTNFTETFEGYLLGSGNPLANCWRRGGNGTVYITNASVAPMSPVNRLYMNASGSITAPTEAFAILPPVSNLAANTHRLRFKAYATAVDRFLEIGYVTDPLNVSTFVTLQVINLPSTAATSATQFIIIPGALPAGVKHLVIKNSGVPSSTTTAYLDDFRWELIPTCVEPTTPLVNTVTNNSATLSWTEAGSATAWQIEYGAPGFTLGTGTLVAASSNPFVLTGLTANTNYDYYVRAVCSTTDSSYWTDPKPFRTLCEDAALIDEDFEGYPTGSSNPLPECWTKLGSGFTYLMTGSATPMSAVNRIYMSANGASTPPTQAIAVLPPLSNLSAGSHQLKFKAFSTTANKSIEVGYLTNPLDAASFVVLTSYNLPGTSVSTTQEFTFTPTTIPAGIKMLALRNAPTTATSTIIYIDDVKWEINPDLSTDTFDTANFSYYPNPVTDVLTLSYSNIISEVVVYNLLGQQVMTAQPNATQTQMDLSGLTNGTYMVKVTSEEIVKTIKVIKK